MLSRQAAKLAKKETCHFDRREKSFLDPSRSLGMTGLGPLPWRLCAFARDMVFPTSSSFPNFKYSWLGFKHQVARQNRLQHAAADGQRFVADRKAVADFAARIEVADFQSRGHLHVGVHQAA